MDRQMQNKVTKGTYPSQYTAKYMANNSKIQQVLPFGIVQDFVMVTYISNFLKKINAGSIELDGYYIDSL